MSRRSQNALRQLESVDTSDIRMPAPSTGEPTVSPSSAENKGSFFKVTMMLWGAPLILFIIIAILKECEVL